MPLRCPSYQFYVYTKLPPKYQSVTQNDANRGINMISILLLVLHVNFDIHILYFDLKLIATDIEDFLYILNKCVLESIDSSAGNF